MAKKQGNESADHVRSSATWKESETGFSSIYNSMSEGLALHEIIYERSGKAVDYIITEVNPAYEKITSLKRNAIVGRKATEVYSVDKAPYLDVYSGVASSGKPVTFETYFPPMKKHFNISVFSPGEGKFGTTFQDITERRLTEEALHKSEERLRVTLTSIGDAVLTVDINGQIEFLNPVAVALTGWKLSEAVGQPSNKVFNIINEETQLPADDIIKRVLLEGKTIGLANHTALIKKDGLQVPIEDSAAPIRDKSGKLTGVILVFHDVTEKRRAHEASQIALVKYKTLFNCLPVDITVADENGRILESNSLSEVLLGLTPEEQRAREISGAEWKIINSEGLAFPQSEFPSVKALKEKHPVENVEIGVVRTDNTISWLNVSATPIPLQGYGVLITYSDISKRKEAEDALRESEYKYHQLFNSIIEGFCIIEMIFDENNKPVDYRFLEINSVFEKQTGLYNARGRLMRELAPGQEDYWYEIYGKIALTGEPVRFENEAKALNRWFEVTAFRTDKPESHRVAICFNDITERKKAEEDLRESEEKLWSVLNATQESIYMFNRKGIIIMSNTVGVERKQSIDKNALIGHHFSEFIPAPVAKARQAKLNEVFNTGKPLEIEDERDGRIYHHNFFPVFSGNLVSHVVDYSADITERQRFMSELKESEERFRTIAESLPVQISISRASDYTLRFTNETYDKIFGYEKGSLIGSSVKDLFFDPADPLRVIEKLRKDGWINEMEVRVKRSDGSPFWILMSIRIIIFEGEPAYLNAFVDITESKKTREKLLQMNRTLNAHSRSSKVMMHAKNELDYLNQVCNIITHDCGHRMVWIGYAQNDRQKSVKPIVHCGFDMGYIEKLNISWADNEHGRGPTGIAIRTGKPSMCKNMQTDPAFGPWREAAIKRGYSSSLVLPLILDGKPFGAVTIYSKEPDPFSESEIELLSDLTDDLAYGISFLRLEESERSATKLIKENEAKLKELVATKDKFFNIVAHDLKNPFTSMLGSSELLYDHIDGMTTQNIKKLALILNDSAKGGYSILLNLLDWSRSQTGQLQITPQEINLKELVDENISNLQLPATVKEISINYESGDSIILTADKNMLHTILRNLLSNALKYTNKNGKVVVSAEVKPDFITIFIKDNGVGISRDRIDKLFRLEMRNSMPGTQNEQGTGLGLKLCKEFVEKHGGTITVDSTEGKGSTFSFTIPMNHAL